MKTGFPGPLQPRQKETKKNPWDFRMPDYDDRTSCYTNAGSHYGVGQKQPVGHKSGASMDVACLPSGRVDTAVTRNMTLKNLPLDVQE